MNTIALWIIIVAVAILLVIAIIKYFEYINPYTEEIVSTRSMSAFNGYDERVRDFNIVKYKRTYKNGKVEFIDRRE